jgi:site-specific DNA recombinase
MPEIAEATLRLAIYARVSTEEQREGQNIDSQIAELERFSRDKAWPIVGVYKDEGWSGGVMERPELDHLRDDAQKGLFDAALINDVDRLARDVAHLGIIKRDLERKGVKVIFRKLPSDASATSNLMVNILGSFAEFERELIADRTRRGRRHKVEVRKQYLGSNTAYGYRYVPIDRLTGKEGILEVNPAEAAIVRRMFEWVDQDGLSARRVLLRLDELKIQPKKGAALWGKSSVLRILRNEMYTGVWHYNKYQGCEPKNPLASSHYRKRSKCSVRPRPRSEWLPLALPESLHIIPRERWLRVQEQLDRNIAFSPRNEKHAYLLKGLIQCGGCGARYVGEPCHGKFYYRCMARCKKLRSVRESLIDDAVKRAVTNVMVKPEVILEPLRQLGRADARQRERREDTVQKVEQESQQLATEESRILEAYRAGIISPAQLGRQLEILQARKSALDVQRTELQAGLAVDTEQAEKTVIEYCIEAAKNLAGFNHERWRDFLRIIVQVIVFQGDHIIIRGRIPTKHAHVGSLGDLNIESSL